MRHVPSEKIQGTYMPKSAITISDVGSLVRKRIFSGLFTSHGLDPKIGKVKDKRGEATYLRSRWTMPWSCKYFTPDKTELRVK